MKRHLALGGKGLAGAGLSGAVLYLVTTASAHRPPVWPYWTLLGMIVAGLLLYSLGQENVRSGKSQAGQATDVQETAPGQPSLAGAGRSSARASRAPEKAAAEDAERLLAVMRSFDVPADHGLDRNEASRICRDHGYSPRSFGGWVAHGWIARDGDRRYLTDKGRRLVADQEALHGSHLHGPAASVAVPAQQARHGPALAGTQGTGRQASVRVPTSAEFRAAMANIPAGQRDLLKSACDWAETLERGGLATLVTSRGSKEAVSNLMPLLIGKKVSFVRIYLDGRLMLARSVCETWAPRSLPAVEAALGAELTQGSSTRTFSDELRDALTAAYQEAASTAPSYSPRSSA
jgi:hypothetical protein